MAKELPPNAEKEGRQNVDLPLMLSLIRRKQQTEANCVWSSICLYGESPQPHECIWLQGRNMTSLPSPVSRRHTPCSRVDLKLLWGFLDWSSGQLLIKSRSLPHRELCAGVQWLAVGSRWLSNTSSRERGTG